MAAEQVPNGASAVEIRRLAHRMRNHLFVLGLGLDTLQGQSAGTALTEKTLLRMRDVMKELDRTADALDDLAPGKNR